MLSLFLHNHRWLLFILVFSACPIQASNNSMEINDYQPLFLPGFDQAQNFKIAIRSYHAQGALHYLLVDPLNLTTEVTTATKFTSRRQQSRNKLGYPYWRDLQNTRYGKALEKYLSPPYPLHNYGLTQATKDVSGMFLSVDLCPSVNPFERAFFDELIDQANASKKPFPIAIAISGLWLIHHPSEFSWLLK